MALDGSGDSRSLWNSCRRSEYQPHYAVMATALRRVSSFSVGAEDDELARLHLEAVEFLREYGAKVLLLRCAKCARVLAEGRAVSLPPFIAWQPFDGGGVLHAGQASVAARPHVTIHHEFPARDGSRVTWYQATFRCHQRCGNKRYLRVSKVWAAFAAAAARGQGEIVLGRDL